MGLEIILIHFCQVARDHLAADQAISRQQYNDSESWVF